MSAKLTEQDRLGHHYNYELEMLGETFRLIGSSRCQIIENALKESFCLHARALIEFFVKKGNEYTKEGYTPFDKCRGKVKNLNILLNNQIMHLIFDLRTSDNSEKISDRERAELLRILSDETRRFRSFLKSEYTDLGIRCLEIPPDHRSISFSGSSPTITTTPSTVYAVTGPQFGLTGHPAGPIGSIKSSSKQ